MTIILFGISVFGFAPDETLEILIFGIGLIFLTIGLRWILKRGAEGKDKKIEEIAKEANH